MNVVRDIYDVIWDNPFLRCLAVNLVFIGIAFLTKVLFKKIIKPLALKTKTKVDDLIIKNITSIVFSIILIMGIHISIQHFTFNKDIIEQLLQSFLIILISMLLIRIISDFSTLWLKEWKSRTRTSADERIIPLLQKILKSIVIILGIFFIFSAWKINISPLLTTAGIAGLAIGLAVKDALNNIIGGLQLVLDKTFKVGDKVEIDGKQSGIILDIGLRSTKLITYDNEVIFIPNGILANSQIKNFTQPDFSIRVNVAFGVEYGSNPEKVQKVVSDALQKIEGVLDQPPVSVQFLKMNDSSLDFMARVWVENYSEAYSMKLKVTEEIYAALNKAKIGIPFPTQTIFTKKIED